MDKMDIKKALLEQLMKRAAGSGLEEMRKGMPVTEIMTMKICGEGSDYEEEDAEEPEEMDEKSVRLKKLKALAKPKEA